MVLVSSYSSRTFALIFFVRFVIPLHRLTARDFHHQSLSMKLDHQLRPVGSQSVDSRRYEGRPMCAKQIRADSAWPGLGIGCCALEFECMYNFVTGGV